MVAGPPTRGGPSVLTCVVNVGEGRDDAVLEALAAACGPALLDLHRDADHHRSVLTSGAWATGQVEAAAFALVEAAVTRLDLSGHAGVHPRIGVADVVPFVPLLPGATLDRLAAASLEEAAAPRPALRDGRGEARPPVPPLRPARRGSRAEPS